MLKDIITPQKSLFADGMQTVLRGHENRSRRVVLLKGNLVQNSRSDSRGISARVTRNGRYGFSSTASYTEEDAKTVLRAATENAAFLDARAKSPGRSYPALSEAGNLPLRPIVDFEQKRFIDLCHTVDDYVVAHCPKITSRTVVYTEDSQDKIIVTSDAASGHVSYPRCYLYVMMTAESKEGMPVELFKAFGGGGSFEDHFSDPAAV